MRVSTEMDITEFHADVIWLAHEKGMLDELEELIEDNAGCGGYPTIEEVEGFLRDEKDFIIESLELA